VNVKEYISSGVIESYVLGLATGAEREEFEQMCKQYPEIAEARTAFELALEEQLLQDAPAPPAFLKDKIQQAITNEVTIADTNGVEEEVPVRQMNIWKWVAAASIILLAGSVYWAVTTNKKYQDLQVTNNKLEQDLNQTKENYALLQADKEMLTKPGMKMVALKGTQVAPHAYTTVYWDTTGATKDVYLLINNLPQPVSDKQYQLWALLDGKPIDLGVVDYEISKKKLLVKAQNVQNAQAFAITLENKGGSPTPSLDKMYVMGQL
jgi:anti-sigma-K factor RskA